MHDHNNNINNNINNDDDHIISIHRSTINDLLIERIKSVFLVTWSRSPDDVVTSIVDLPRCSSPPVLGRTWKLHFRDHWQPSSWSLDPWSPAARCRSGCPCKSSHFRLRRLPSSTSSLARHGSLTRQSWCHRTLVGQCPPPVASIWHRALQVGRRRNGSNRSNLGQRLADIYCLQLLLRRFPNCRLPD